MNMPGHDLRLTLAPPDSGKGYCILLHGDPTQRDPTPEPGPPFDRQGFQTRFLDPLHATIQGQTAPDLLVEMGKELARLLLPTPVRSQFYARLLQAPNPTAPIRLRLTIQVRALADLPWEFVYLDDLPTPFDQSGFLCRLPNFHLIRQTAEPTTTISAPGRLARVLIACADPGSARYPLLPHLTQEVESVRAAFPRAEVEVLKHVSPAALQQTLQDWQPDLLYFIGHGEADLFGGKLILQGSRPKEVEPVSGEDLAQWLERTPVRLVVLSACQSADVGRVLAERGIAAVVAMQSEMRSATSPQFARTFCTALAQPCSIEEALKQARDNILPEETPDWGVPVLTLSGDTSELFQPASQEQIFYVRLLRNREFIGREATFTAIHAALSPPKPMPVALYGMGGLGKTHLALEYVYRHRQDYPGGVFWIEATDALRIQEVYADIGSSCFQYAADLPMEQAALRVLQRFAQLTQPALFVFDDLRQLQDLTLFPTGANCRILVTSRLRPLRRQGFHAIDTPSLDEATALAMLLRAGVHDPAEEEAARDIARRMGYLPLALRLVSQYVDRVGISLRAYRDRHNTPQSVAQSIHAAFQISYDSPTLQPADRAILCVAACFAGQGISRDLLFQACVLEDRDAFDEGLGNLADLSLLTYEEGDRLTLHDLLREFAQKQMSAEERRTALARVVHALILHLKRANEKMDWQNQDRREIAHCRAVLEQCDPGEMAPEREALLLEMGAYLLEQGDYQTATWRFQEGLEIATRRFGTRHIQVALFLRRLSEAAEQDVRYTEAVDCARTACDIAAQVLPPKDPKIADYAIILGLAHKRLGDHLQETGQHAAAEPHFAAARHHYAQALRIYVRAYSPSAPHKVAEIRNNIGMLHKSQGRLDAALRYLKQALAIHERIHSFPHVMIAVGNNNIGLVLARQSAWKEALDYHQKALGIYRAAWGQPHPDIAASLFYSGTAQSELGQIADAIRSFEEAAAIYLFLYGPQYDLYMKCLGQLQRLREKSKEGE
jgi:tetratricopeptide (TPR) repeat protein